MRLELSAPIVDVRVYPDRALVTRRGEVAIPEAGEHDIVLGQLARSLERQSIRASGRGTARSHISSVDLDYEYHAAAPEQGKIDAPGIDAHGFHFAALRGGDAQAVADLRPES